MIIRKKGPIIIHMVYCSIVFDPNFTGIRSDGSKCCLEEECETAKNAII